MKVVYQPPNPPLPPNFPNPEVLPVQRHQGSLVMLHCSVTGRNHGYCLSRILYLAHFSFALTLWSINEPLLKYLILLPLSLHLQRDIMAQRAIRGRSRASIPGGALAEMGEIGHFIFSEMFPPTVAFGLGSKTIYALHLPNLSQMARGRSREDSDEVQRRRIR